MISDKEAADLDKMIEKLKKQQVIDTKVSVEEARQILNDKYGVPTEDRGPLDLTFQIEKLFRKDIKIDFIYSMLISISMTVIFYGIYIYVLKILGINII